MIEWLTSKPSDYLKNSKWSFTLTTIFLRININFKKKTFMMFHVFTAKSNFSKHLLLTANFIFKVQNKNTETMCEICSKLLLKALERLVPLMLT